MSEQEKMEAMHEWLNKVRTELKLEHDPLDGVTDEFLDLIRIIAHGPSRPGAPLSAFLIGYVCAQTNQEPSELIASIAALANDE